jgi:hypothetical protein
MTMIETRPVPKSRRKAERTYTTTEVLDLTGLSFRVLDYWLRTKVVVLSNRNANTPGSGNQRLYTPDEVAAISRLADRYRKANAELEAIRSGEAWTLEIREREILSRVG